MSFSVHITGVGSSLHFQEVSGLDTEPEPIDNRPTRTGLMSARKPRGIQKSTHIVLKRGVMTKDTALVEWLDGMNRYPTVRSTATITLLDETGNPAMRWILADARPTKITAPDLNAGGNEVAVEALELTCEGITVDKD